MIRDEKLDLRRLAEIVSYDQALSTKVLKVVNSSFYALSSPCTTIHQSLVYLGLNTIKTLVLGFGLVDSINSSDTDDNTFDYVEYWTRMLYTATAAREIARRAGIDPEEAFLSGLMQDIGIVAILRVYDERYVRIVKSTERDHRRLCRAEQKALDFDHTQVGGEVAEHWKLPEQFVQSIRFHHDSSRASKQWRKFVQVGELANCAADSMILDQPDTAREGFSRQASEWFDLNPKQCQKLLAGLIEMVADLSELFQLETEEPPNVVDLMEQAEEQLIIHQMSVQEETNTLRKSNEDLAKQTMTDPLTGVANRKYFDQALPHHFKSALEDNSNLGLIFMDLDRFKSINDQHGHQVGDVVLAEVARLMTMTLGDQCEVCRYGGEEFAVLVPGSSRIQTAKLAESLRRDIAGLDIELSAIPEAPPSIRVTASLGVAALEQENVVQMSRPDLLVRVSDQAVYAAKDAGRNCVRVFNPASYTKSAA